MPDVIVLILSDANVVDSLLHELGPAEGPVHHLFKLEDEQPVYPAERRRDSKHNDIGREELDMMLKARIVTSVTPAWLLPVEIEPKEDGKPQFCIDYWTLNQKMKADRSSLPKVQESFDGLAGCVMLTTLDLF